MRRGFRVKSIPVLFPRAEEVRTVFFPGRTLHSPLPKPASWHRAAFPRGGCLFQLHEGIIWNQACSTETIQRSAGSTHTHMGTAHW